MEESLTLARPEELRKKSTIALHLLPKNGESVVGRLIGDRIRRVEFRAGQWLASRRGQEQGGNLCNPVDRQHYLGGGRFAARHPGRSAILLDRCSGPRVVSHRRHGVGSDLSGSAAQQDLDELVKFLRWATSDGQEFAGDLKYGRLMVVILCSCKSQTLIIKLKEK